MGSSHLFLFISVETTGNDPILSAEHGLGFMPWHEIIELGGVIAESAHLEEVSAFEAKIKPEHPERCLPHLTNRYPQRAMAGEWDLAVSLAVAIDSLLHWWKQYARDCLLVPVGHNSNFLFDWIFLKVAFAQCGVDEAVWKNNLHFAGFGLCTTEVEESCVLGMDYDSVPYKFSNERWTELLGISFGLIPHGALSGARELHAAYKELVRRTRERERSGNL